MVHPSLALSQNRSFISLFHDLRTQNSQKIIAMHKLYVNVFILLIVFPLGTCEKAWPVNTGSQIHVTLSNTSC